MASTLLGCEGAQERQRLLKFSTQGLVPRELATHHKFTVSDDQEHSWGPAGLPEGKEQSAHFPSLTDGREKLAQALLEEAAPSVNFLEAQFAHHQSHSGRRVISRGCLRSPESPGLAGRVQGGLPH